jgi:hypothetical protein
MHRVLLLAILMAGALFAEITPTWLVKRPVPAEKGKITIALTGAATSHEWTVALKPSTRGKSFVAAIGASKGQSRVTRYAAWRDSSISNDTVTIDGAGSSSDLIVYGELPSGTIVSVKVGDAVAYSGTVDNMMRFVDGAQEARPVKGIAEVLLHQRAPERKAPGFK